MTILILSVIGIVLLSILSWLYQFRGLSPFWIKLLLPLYLGVGMAIVWGDLFIIGFLFGYGVGWIGVPIMLAINPCQTENLSPVEQKCEEHGSESSRS